MNDWHALQQRWQAQPLSAEDAERMSLLEPMHRRLRSQVRRRDMRETLAAAFVVLGFIVIGSKLWLDGRQLAALLAFLLVAWACMVPVQLRRSRMRDIAPDLPMQQYLHDYRVELQRQSRLLKNAWAWYVLPPTVLALGMTLSIMPIATKGAWIHGAITVALGIGVAWWNRYAARKSFDGEIAKIDRMLEASDPRVHR